MIVSASRRTDLPAFYLPWFLRRLEKGWCRVANPFRPSQQRLVSLRPEHVSAMVFWTRRPDRLAGALDQIEARGHRRTMALVTVVEYGRDLHPYVPSTEKQVAGFRRLARRYGDPRRVCWRYDPILLGPRDSPDDHRRRFARLARLLEGSTRRVIVSFVDLYRKTERRLAQVAGGGYPLAAGDQARDLLRDLAREAAGRGMEMRSCAEPLCYVAEGVPAGRCIDPGLLAEVFDAPALPSGKDRGQRPACGCAPSVDIGAADSCLHGCVYCYAVRSHRVARRAHDRHAPAGDILLPVPLPASLEDLPWVPAAAGRADQAPLSTPSKPANCVALSRTSKSSITAK